MKAQRYTYKLTDRIEIRGKKRMTEAAAQKANATAKEETGGNWMWVRSSATLDEAKNEVQAATGSKIEVADDGALELSIFGANLRDQSKGQFVVHTCDCKDCDKLRKIGEHEDKGVYTSLLEVSADIASDLITEGSTTAEEYMSEIHFAPCVKLPRGKVVNGEIVAEGKVPVLPLEYFQKPKRTAKASSLATSPAVQRATKSAGKDAFGGRLGTRMSKINKAVIDAGAAGATVLAIAEKLGEPKGIVGAQLGWIFNHKNVKGLVRTTEGDTFRYVYTA